MHKQQQHATVTAKHQPERTKIQEGFAGQRMIVLPPNVMHNITQNPLIQHLYLTAIGYYPHALHHDRERKTGSPEYILLYCVEGSGFIYQGSKCYQLLPNSYIIIPPNTPHHYYSSETDPWSIYWAHFTGDHAGLYYNRYTAGLQAEVNPVPYTESRISLFNQLLTTLESGLGEREIEICNLQFLHFLTTFVYQRELNPLAGKSDAVSRSVAFMKEHLNSNFTIRELASQQSLSVSQFSGLFRRKTGFAPMQYFNQLKVQQSCQYLYFTDRSIKEICLELGFEDPYYFSRLFKKLMGLSPSQYRNMHQK
ncbi:AraC family transcriptional regulator [Botryobacter ruber]|uniref:AraC family transcriptional regulator n=1 Tax=Botryobacter ruber TaxID=2171629 RepID=UPI000E0A15DB|nr:AraC family transcriptional regulator [Botryobacter ruber]